MSEMRGARKLEDGSLIALVILISLILAWMLAPFFGAVLWSMVTVILFAPLDRRILALMPGRRNSAALLTLLIIIAMVIVPSILLGMALLQEAISIYARIQSGAIDLPRMFEQFQAALPGWASSLLQRLGITNLTTVRDMLSAGITSSFQTLATQALLIGQGALSFLVALGVMLYLTFFLLRDGDALSERLSRAVPLRDGQRRALGRQFVTVVRATVRGSIVVAMLQGLIGGIVFWLLGIEGALLWGVLMGLLSLLPAIGTGLVWVPVAIYLLVSGQVWQAVALIVCGVFVIGMVDNLLRPILVGREARMPDYIVLVSTLGGIEMFGFNGFVVGPIVAALFIAAWSILTQARESGEIGQPADSGEATGGN